MSNLAFKIDALAKTKTIEIIGLDDYAYKLINNVDQILETVISNTLKYNKFTTVEEIYDNQSIKNIDKFTIESICEALCLNEGLLIKIINGHKIGYRLHSKIYVSFQP
jgi:hypothetical protein